MSMTSEPDNTWPPPVIVKSESPDTDTPPDRASGARAGARAAPGGAGSEETGSEGAGGDNRGTLVIGASQAGVQLACTLRDLGDTAPIVLVGEEAHSPYQRPPLSKAFIRGEVSADSLTFRNHEFYAGHNIEVAVRERIVRIIRDSDGHGDSHRDGHGDSHREGRGDSNRDDDGDGTAVNGGGIAVAESGRRFRFARLALTTGGVPRTVHFDGSELEGVNYLREATGATVLAAQLAAAHNVVIVGGGFIGLEVAAGARAGGKNVTVIEAADRLIGRAVSGQTAEFYLQAHRRRGISIFLNATVARFTGEHDRVTGVELGGDGPDAGTVIPADVVLIGVGVVPRTELAEQLGLQVANGIVVDAAALASDGTTVAAGDCANMPNPSTIDFGRNRLRLESVQNAVEQAKVAAATLLGLEAEYRTVPWFWSDQADLKLQIAGLNAGYDQIVERGDREAEKLSFLYYRDGRIIAADCINKPVDFMAVRKALHDGLNIPADAAADSGAVLKKLLGT